MIKIYAEGGLGYSIHGLGTEVLHFVLKLRNLVLVGCHTSDFFFWLQLEFYDLLRKLGSPLINHVPEIIASGFLVYLDGVYKTVPWDGNGIPDVLAKYYSLEVSYANGSFPLGLWSKQLFGLSNSTDAPDRPICPYMVTRKCKGDIFARM